MIAQSPGSWTDALWRSVATLLVAAGAVWLAAQLFAAVWQFLLVLAVVVFVLRLAIGGHRARGGW